MGSYTGTVDGKDRAKAIAGVVLVHVGIAAIILSGLNVENIRRAVETMTTISISKTEPPPQPEKTREIVRTPKKPKETGEAGKKAEPTPVVAPEAKLPVPSPIPAAKIAGNDNDASAGAAAAGNGTGAGGAGTGRGGGAGYTPARRISKIPNSTYRQLAATGIPSGSVGVTIKVETDGNVSNCRIYRSSGDRSADSLMCTLTIRYVRFEPARDPSGRPVAQDITFFPNWERR